EVCARLRRIAVKRVTAIRCAIHVRLGCRAMDTDDAWKQWGLQDPYFGVLTNDKFRARKLTDEAKAEFLDSGRGHVEHVMAMIRRHCAPDFAPRRVLDFGCGVGRLVLPFARMAEHVVG